MATKKTEIYNLTNYPISAIYEITNDECVLPLKVDNYFTKARFEIFLDKIKNEDQYLPKLEFAYVRFFVEDL